MPEPVLSVAEMREREVRSWSAGIRVEDVIRAAGAAVGQTARRRTRPGTPVLVLAGTGHNGDDAAVAATHLEDRTTTLIRLAEPGHFEAARQWLDQHRRRSDALVIDGLFGIGLSRPLDGDWAALVAHINDARLEVLAVDVPSGLDADTGEATGPTVEGTLTVTLGSVKRGLLRESASQYVGRLELAAGIGLEPAVASGDQLWTVPHDLAGFPPRRPVSGHKGGFGHVAIIAGSLGYHGAAVLAAEGALRARPGLVTVLTEEHCFLAVASQLRSSMVRPWDGIRLPAENFSGIVVGPGLASPSLPGVWRDEIKRLWHEAPQPIVADASALDWLPIKLDRSAGPRVITPHPGEAARLLKITPATIQQDRFAAVRRLGAGWLRGDVIVVLKGRHTIIGSRTGPLYVNSSGNPGLAQGGTGDVLAGYLGGLLAQPAIQPDVSLAVRYGVWRHGAAADWLDDHGRDWTTEDLVEALGEPL